MQRPIVNHTRRGELVYDPFLGSGTTLIAAETKQRVCYGLELDPKYVDVIVARWQQATGKTATLDGSSATFDEIRSERSKTGPAKPRLQIVARKDPRRRRHDPSDRETNKAA